MTGSGNIIWTISLNCWMEAFVFSLNGLHRWLLSNTLQCGYGIILLKFNLLLIPFPFCNRFLHLFNQLGVLVILSFILEWVCLILLQPKHFHAAGVLLLSEFQESEKFSLSQISLRRVSLPSLMAAQTTDKYAYCNTVVSSCVSVHSRDWPSWTHILNFKSIDYMKTDV